MNRRRGFTLAELLVAASLLSIVMAAVYAAFGSTIRVWKMGETETNQYQDGRIGLNLLSRELGCVLGGSEHLFEGEDDDVEFFAVTPSLNVKEGEGSRVLWVRYYYSNHKLYRQEAVVEGPLPLTVLGEDEEKKEKERVKLGRKRKFEIADDVRDFEISYVWIPVDKERDPKRPPRWMPPIVLDRNEKGWGLPQGLKIRLSLRNPDDKKQETEFLLCKAFHGPTSVYDEEKMGKPK